MTFRLQTGYNYMSQKTSISRRLVADPERQSQVSMEDVQRKLHPFILMSTTNDLPFTHSQHCRQITEILQTFINFEKFEKTRMGKM